MSSLGEVERGSLISGSNGSATREEQSFKDLPDKMGCGLRHRGPEWGGVTTVAMRALALDTMLAFHADRGGTMLPPGGPEGLRALFATYPHIGRVLPAVGYDRRQLEDLRETINRAEANVVVAATPIDLAALIDVNKPVVRARYEFADAGEPTLGSAIDAFLAQATKTETA